MSTFLPFSICATYCTLSGDALSFGFELKKQNRLALIKGDKKDAIRKGGILVICRIAENRYNDPVGANGSLEKSAYRLLERQG